MTINKVISKFYEYYAKALSSDYVIKPISWALYQTWKWADSKEKSKEGDNIK